MFLSFQNKENISYIWVLCPAFSKIEVPFCIWWFSSVFNLKSTHQVAHFGVASSDLRHDSRENRGPWEQSDSPWKLTWETGDVLVIKTE